MSTSPTILPGSRRRLHRRKSRPGACLLGVLLGLALAGAACGGACPPIAHDDVFPLDLNLDAGAPIRLNCGSLADGCAIGQACPAACDCVIARERMTMSPMTVIDGCVLAGGTAMPSVEVRSHLKIDCE